MAKTELTPAAPDDLVLTIRVHDPLEKKDHTLSASWVTVRIPRADIGMATTGFLGRYIRPALKQLKNLRLT